jgi:hypothetical protein
MLKMQAEVPAAGNGFACQRFCNVGVCIWLMSDAHTTVLVQRAADAGYCLHSILQRPLESNITRLVSNNLAVPFCPQADAELAKLQQEAKAEANRLTSVSAAPEKARRQADMAVAELQGAQGLLAAADSALLEAEAALRAAHDKERQKQVSSGSAEEHAMQCSSNYLRLWPMATCLCCCRHAEAVSSLAVRCPSADKHALLIALCCCWRVVVLMQLEYASALAALERGRIMAEAKERHADDVAHDVELAGEG